MTFRRLLSIAPALLVLCMVAPTVRSEEKEPGLDPKLRALLADGVDDVQSGKHERAAMRLWKFLQAAPEDLPEYERGELYLGEALDALGYPHAAMELWINVGRGRRDARLLGPALVHLSETAQHRPYDADLIVDRLLGDTEFGYAPEGADDFVHWHQALTDFRLGYRQWGTERLAKIRDDSPWGYIRRYYDAVRMLAADDVGRARLRFEDLAAADPPSPVLRRRVEATLARLAYEDGEWQKALDLYAKIQAPPQEMAPLIVEQAWCYYRMGSASRALGLLASLEAPMFRGYEDPERYLLIALIYKDLCHFEAAQAAVGTFRKRFAATLEAIHGRAELSEDPVFLALALREPEVADRYRLKRDLEEERERLEQAPRGWKRKGLTAFLDRIYDVDLDRANRAFMRSFREATEGVGDGILDAEEQMNVVQYEIELARNRRAKDPLPPAPGELITEVPLFSPITYYWFDDEYWTDEIPDLRVVIESKCEETQ